MSRLPVASDTVDGVVALWSLIHVPLAEHPAVIDEFARVLRPGGGLLLVEGTTEWVGENPDWLEGGVEMAWEVAGRETTRRQLRAAGFGIEAVWGVPEALDGDGKVADAVRVDGEEASDLPWTLFSCRLE
jgi:SAM-dependent methyltransferase